MQAKCLGELVSVFGAWLRDRDDPEGANIFKGAMIYVVLVTWLVTVAVWLFRMNEALGKYNPLFIIPLLLSNLIFCE